MTPLTLEQALRLLSELTGWFKADVDRHVYDATELAAARCIEARNVILAAKKNGSP